MTRKQKKMLTRIIVSALLLAVIRVWNPEGLWALCYLVPYAVIGWD